MFNSYKYMFGYGLYYFFNKNSYILEYKKEPVHIVGNRWATYHFVKSLDKRFSSKSQIQIYNYIKNNLGIKINLENPVKNRLKYLIN